jgi:hypothetical protein
MYKPTREYEPETLVSATLAVAPDGTLEAIDERCVRSP